MCKIFKMQKIMHLAMYTLLGHKQMVYIKKAVKNIIV